MMQTAAPGTPKREGRRLDPQTWTDAALELLAESGVDAVRVEPLSRRLGVTKGSFYWHFKDRPDLLAAMLLAWRRKATLTIIERLERAHADPIERLRQLIDLPLLGRNSATGANLELAIRLWARSDTQAADALKEIDAQRLAHIGSLLRESGASDSTDVEARAFMNYAFMLAEAFVTTRLSKEALKLCTEVLAAAPSKT